MSDGPRWPPSPAWPWIRVLVAGVFFGVWLVCVVADWFWHPEGSLVPAWFQALGVLCLGYLLGIDLIETVRRGTRR